MFPFKHLVALSGMIGIVFAVIQIQVHCGELSVEGYQKCEIVHDNEFVNYTGPEKKTIPTLRFGLITYRCDNHAGDLVSTFDCRGCGFYCTNGEFLLGSQQEVAQFWGGIITGVFLTITMGALLYKCLCKSLKTKLFGFQYFLRRELNSETHKNASMASVGNYDKMHIAKKTEEAAECGQNQSNSQTDINEMSIEDEGKHRGMGSSRKHIFTALISGILLVKSVNACDLTLHVGANELTAACFGTECHNPPPPLFSVSLGQKICFEDHFGNAVVVNVSELSYRSRYELMYYTSKYHVVNLTSHGGVAKDPYGNFYHWNEKVDFTKFCHSPGSICNSTTHLDLEEVQNRRMTSHQGSACEFRIFDYESQYLICCSYHWNLERGPELYPVYINVAQTWNVKFSAVQNNYSQEIQLSTYDPTGTLLGFKLDLNDVPLHITVLNVMGNMSELHNALLLYNDVLYNINASKVYKPSFDFFGEIQLPLNKDGVVFTPPKDGVCYPAMYCSSLHDSSCQWCECKFPESKMSSFVTDLSLYTVPNSFLMRKNDNSVVDTFDILSKGTLTMKIGNWKISDSPVINAKCNIDYVMSHGCSSCNSLYIVLAPRNIEKEGIVPFHSNCSFDKPYLKCDLVETLKLVMKKNYSTCYLRMPTLNQSMVINIEYLNFNHTFDSSGKINITANYTQEFTHFITSQTFTATLIKTVLFCTILGLVLTVFSRVINKFKQRKETETETGLVQF